MRHCVSCAEPVDWWLAQESMGLDRIIHRVDLHGVESLTETEQVAYDGRVCYDCLESDLWKEKLDG